MANIRIPYLVPKKNKAGVITTWHWQPSAALARYDWPAVPLGADEGVAMNRAREINEQVAQWRNGGAKPKAVAAIVKSATLGAGIARYRTDCLYDPKLTPTQNAAEGRVAASTSKTYRTALDRIDFWAGKHPIAYVTPMRVRALADAQKDARTGIGHHATHTMLRMGSTLFKYLRRKGLATSNPFEDHGLAAPRSRTQLWEHDDEGAFRAVALDKGLPGMDLAMELAIYTAQRESDLIGFTEHQYRQIELYDPALTERFADADGIVMGWVSQQAKTGNPFQIPFDLKLRARVEAALRHNRAVDRAADRLVTHVLVDERDGGIPWLKHRFIRTWQELRDLTAKTTGRPHIRELHWHDLKRTRVVRLRRMGLKGDQIATITATSPKSIEAMLAVYGTMDATMTAATLANVEDMVAKREARTARDEQRKEAQG